LYVALPVEIQIVTRAKPGEAQERIEEVLADVQKAMEVRDELMSVGERSLAWAGERVLERQPGTTTAGVGVTYIAAWARPWGTP
jgi:hypothetical protein